MKFKILAVLLFIVSLPVLCTSQNIGVGAAAIYNFQTESFGAGLRASILPNKRLSIVPQFSYFFPFNKIHEYTAGLGLEFKFIKQKKINFYAIGHGAYNCWLNYKSSPLKGAQQDNWNLEGGIGVSTNTCLRPFLEYRYNLKFRETHLDLGFIYIFGCRQHSSPDRCPAFYY